MEPGWSGQGGEKRRRERGAEMRDRSMKGGSRQKKTPVRVMRAGVSGGGRLGAAGLISAPDCAGSG